MKMQARQTQHEALPEPDHDECARQDFVVSLRQHLTQVTGKGNYALFKNRIEPAYVRAIGKPPANAYEVRDLMQNDPVYQFWSAAQRASQEMIWDAVIDTAERTWTDKIDQAGATQPVGSLELDPELAIPRYNSVYDIHLQPGGYHSEQRADDIAAGVIYDLGVPIYSMGGMGPENDYCGGTLVKYVRQCWPTLKPQRILDLGCTIGNSTLPWARAFREAEVHGVDVAAPCLRYGHMRANALNIPVHLHQCNAEALGFTDNSFDIVASALMLHETSRPAVARILAEACRVLKPGGVLVILDGFNDGSNEPIMEFLGLWEAFNNNERFLITLRGMDVAALAKESGFSEARLESTSFGPENVEVGGKADSYTSGFTFKVPILVAVK